MPKAPLPSRLKRWLTILAFWLVQAVLIYTVFGVFLAEDEPKDLFRILTDPEWIRYVGPVILSVMALQIIFLIPVNKPGVVKEHGRSIKFSLAITALAIAGLIGAGVAAILSIPIAFGYEPLDYNFSGIEINFFTVALIVTGISWLVFTPILFRFSRNGPCETFLGRIAARLFLGTIVETVAIIPLDVMVRRKTDCYCSEGTFYALLITGSIGFFALGPAIYLPMLSKRRKRYYACRCDVCGYDMTGCLNAHQCPECGSGWRKKQEVTGMERKEKNNTQKTIS